MIIYVLSSATGTATGADWTNAYTTLTAAAAAASRGDTIYVGDGSYAGVTFSVAVSGTTLITVKKAIESDHGTETGWNSAFGDGQAIITSDCSIAQGYWAIDGQRGSLSYNTDDYGFFFSSVVGTRVAIYLTGAVEVPMPGVTIQHVAAVADSDANYSKMFVRCGSQVGPTSDLTITDCYTRYFGQTVSSAGQNATFTGMVFARNLCLDATNSGSFHGDVINSNGVPIDEASIYSNIFDNCSGTATIVANNSNIKNTNIYNNVFIGSGGGNGTIAGTSNACLENVSIYNNTVIGPVSGPWVGGSVIGSASMDAGKEYIILTVGTTNWVSVGAASNTIGVVFTASGSAAGTGTCRLNAESVTVKNNLLYSAEADVSASGTYDYNGYFSCTNVPSETHGVTSATDPFLDSVGENYRLATGSLAIGAGDNLAASFTTDFIGLTRSSWDMGAFSFPATTNHLSGSRRIVAGGGGL